MAEQIYDEAPNWEDPVKFSFAYGGKDGVPFPVGRKAMDESIQILKESVQAAKIGDKEKMHSLQSLSARFHRTQILKAKLSLLTERMSEPKNVAKQRIGAASGIIAPIIAFTCILLAIASYSQFSWTNNALSDLGIISGLTGPLFNLGLLASGLLAFSFAIFGLFNYLGKIWVGKIGSSFFAAATLSLICIGIFNENFSPTHYLVSVAFFVLVPISLFIVTSVFWLNHHRGMAIFTFLIAIAVVLPWLLLFTFNYVPNVAIPEFLSGLAVSAWTIVLGKKMLKP